MLSFFFFFFKQKTAYEMRISDWSSDVCSSDLVADLAHAARGRSGPQLAVGDFLILGEQRPRGEHRVAADAAAVHHRGFQADEGPIRQRAAVDHREMADQHILADDRWQAFGTVRHRAVAMDDAAVLDLRARADDDMTDLGAEHAIIT